MKGEPQSYIVDGSPAPGLVAARDPESDEEFVIFDGGRHGYLLMEQPSETQGKDWLSTPSTYTAVEIQLDWAEQRVLETTLFPLGLLKFQFHYLRPAGDHFLLLGARCAYRENGPDQNAWIVSRDGAVLSRFCLGDGIQDCVVKKDGTIITSYFDEGVFGNYGWDEPLGDCGLIAWTSDGTPLWKNEKYSIYDCYAISLDEEENLWFYYYDEFRLVRTNFKEDFVFELPIEGSGAFSVAPSGNTFLFQGGYQQRDKFYFLTAHGDRLGQKQEAILASEAIPGYITGYLRGGCFGRKRRPLKPWQSRNMEAYRFRNHSILCWFSNGRKMVFFTIERPEQMCYNGFENVLEDKEEGVTEA